MSDKDKQQRLDDLEKRLREVREAKDKGTPEHAQKQREVTRDLNASMDRGDLDTRTPHNGAVFYDNGQSGYVPMGAQAQPTHYQESNRDRANAFCARPGNEHCRTIEHTQGGAWLDRQKLHETIPEADSKAAWNKLSSQYARNATGESNAFVRTESAEHRTFKSTEQPELQHSPQMTGITYHHVDHGYEMTHHQHLARPQAEHNGPPPRPQAGPPGSGPPPRPQAASAGAGPPPRGSAPSNPAPESPSKGKTR